VPSQPDTVQLVLLLTGGVFKPFIRTIARVVSAISVSPPEVYRLAFSPTEPLLGAGSDDKTVRLWR